MLLYAIAMFLDTGVMFFDHNATLLRNTSIALSNRMRLLCAVEVFVYDGLFYFGGSVSFCCNGCRYS
jgi:hypothetical protein